MAKQSSPEKTSDPEGSFSLEELLDLVQDLSDKIEEHEKNSKEFQDKLERIKITFQGDGTDGSGLFNRIRSLDERLLEVENVALTKDMEEVIPETLLHGVKPCDLFREMLSAVIQAQIAKYPQLMLGSGNNAVRMAHLMTAVELAHASVTAVVKKMPSIAAAGD